MLFLLFTRPVRLAAGEQFLLMATKCSAGHRPLIFFITLCFSVLQVSQTLGLLASYMM